MDNYLLESCLFTNYHVYELNLADWPQTFDAPQIECIDMITDRFISLTLPEMGHKSLYNSSFGPEYIFLQFEATRILYLLYREEGDVKPAPKRPTLVDAICLFETRSVKKVEQWPRYTQTLPTSEFTDAQTSELTDTQTPPAHELTEVQAVEEPVSEPNHCIPWLPVRSIEEPEAGETVEKADQDQVWGYLHDKQMIECTVIC